MNPSNDPFRAGDPAQPREVGRTFLNWPVLRQFRGPDRLGRGAAVKSSGSAHLHPRIADADAVVKSVCPYCAVGCGQNVYVKDRKVVQIEGDPDSPVSRGRLCPKGSASLQLTTGGARRSEVLYRRAARRRTGRCWTWTPRWTWWPTG